MTYPPSWKRLPNMASSHVTDESEPAHSPARATLAHARARSRDLWSMQYNFNCDGECWGAPCQRKQGSEAELLPNSDTFLRRSGSPLVSVLVMIKIQFSKSRPTNEGGFCHQP